MLAAAGGGLVAFGIACAIILVVFNPSGRDGTTGSPLSSSYIRPPSAEVQRIRDTLHDIAARCAPEAGAEDQRQLDHDVDVILAFAERYPNAEFPVDDETGHTLSLLLAVRDDLTHCAPAAAARITTVLPAPLRQTAGASQSSSR